MAKRRVVVVLSGLIMIGVGFGCAQAQEQTHESGLTPQDYIDIQQLYARYVRAVDMGGSGDGSDYLALFTEDATFEEKGKLENIFEYADMREMVQGYHVSLQKNGYSSRHVFTGLYISQTPDGAQGSVYALRFNVTATPPVVLQSGVYEDTLVKTPSGWRFKKRVFKPSNTYEPGMPVGLP